MTLHWNLGLELFFYALLETFLKGTFLWLTIAASSV